MIKSKKILLSLAFVSVVLILICSGCKKIDLQAKGVTIKGKVTDCNGVPISLFPIMIQNNSQVEVVTDVLGQFQVKGDINGNIVTVMKSINAGSAYEFLDFAPIEKNGLSDNETIDIGTIKTNCMSYVKADLWNACANKQDSVYVYYTTDPIVGNTPWNCISPSDVTSFCERTVGALNIPLPPNQDIWLWCVRSEDDSPASFWHGNTNTMGLVYDFGKIQYCDQSMFSSNVSNIAYPNMDNGFSSIVFDTNEIKVSILPYFTSTNRSALYISIPNAQGAGTFGNADISTGNTENYYTPFGTTCTVTIDNRPTDISGEYVTGSYSGMLQSNNIIGLHSVSGTFKVRIKSPCR